MFKFPIITSSLQEAYEQGTKGSQDKTPEICGYYGRACRRMDKEEGANRALCCDCGLAHYCTPYPTEEELSEFEPANFQEYAGIAARPSRRMPVTPATGAAQG